MKKLTVNVLLLMMVSTSQIPVASAAQAPQYVLEKVVTLSRHGVRPQTDSASLQKATGQAWPEWTVPDGFLTGHGYMGVAQQGAYQLKQWLAQGLPLKEQQHCPTPGSVWVWAAPDQRTKATGMALVDGMFPGCGIAVHSASTPHDPLFDTLEMGLAHPDMAVVKQEVMARMGSPEEAAKRYQPAVDLLRQAVCTPDKDSCTFLDKPWKVKISDNGKVKLGGPVSAGATIGETIRLQYSENLPLEQVAFGHAASAEQVSALMALHAAKYDLVSDTPEYARHGGSILMRQLLNALTAGTQNPTSQTINPALQRPLVMLVGHDTNIAQIQTMLGFNWQLPVYPRNDIPPGGSLNLARYKNTQTGEQLVRITFSARTLDQWRQLSPLNAQHPLPEAEFQAAWCKKTDVGTLCPLAEFVSHVRQQLVDDGKDMAVFK
ncbi:histidine-type phosphatase [Mangrovibacter phragmitis]|uniref:histidine-type phosphatase n=1 Tax=Mangrovibacter phragmitis TaxID=1691903 RepID=UPI00336A91E5